ncbi:MAG TPA: hypothetical protein VIT68_01740 [Candidatus Gracilibacteria bacterium]
MPNTNQTDPVTLSTAFIRLFLGLGSGLVGTLILAIILFLSWNIVGEFITQATIANSDTGIMTEAPEVHPLFLNFITIAIFLSGLGATITYGVLISVVEERYPHRATMLTHVFVGNLVILIMMLPIYFFSSRIGVQNGILMSLFVHAILITIFSYLSMAITNQSQHLLMHTYGIVWSVVIFCFALSFIVDKNIAILVFFTFPILLAATGFGTATTEMFYQWISKIYGIDFLNADKKYGNDYEEEALSYDDL